MLIVNRVLTKDINIRVKISNKPEEINRLETYKAK
ncbi:hypothetical protein FPSE_06342 [Fusarium pseudograminearum CS3096]|uniref:Uncharacterized protein n=1 Tax=Fusarium pseudograminearum (strain CS3096) TaxID=1028729 RepID=K3W039_FUSPC|nr:hypothetical protein FPSE_06342 [Fusarium pseudograminearum CS3096]EKJ73480.1 hypothetical protein FPSE_06342 [Fusarium pseudograminearum CS3096]